ncbi:hypothetical protein OROGR_025657 [Orobanche gracilis]
MKKISSTTDEAAFNGELHGELYSPEYAVHINTEEEKLIRKDDKNEEQQIEKGQQQQQGDLYSPGRVIQTSVSSQQKNKHDDSDEVEEAAEGRDVEKANGVGRTKKLRRPLSKL